MLLGLVGERGWCVGVCVCVCVCGCVCVCERSCVSIMLLKGVGGDGSKSLHYSSLSKRKYKALPFSLFHFHFGGNPPF